MKSVPVVYKPKKRTTVSDNTKTVELTNITNSQQLIGLEMEVSGYAITPKAMIQIQPAKSDAETQALIDRTAQVMQANPDGPIRLTEKAHEYNLQNYQRLIDKSEGYKALTVDHATMALELALFILRNDNGPDVAKRFHLLELIGGEWKWMNSGREESKAKDGTDKEQDVYLSWLGTTFLVAARASLTWKEQVEFQLGLHRQEHEESKVAKI